MQCYDQRLLESSGWEFAHGFITRMAEKTVQHNTIAYRRDQDCEECEEWQLALGLIVQ